MSDEVKRALIAARELIAKRENWTQFAQARDCEDNYVYAGDTDACKWCASGAVMKITGFRNFVAPFEEEEMFSECMKTLNKSIRACFDDIFDLVMVNDTLGHDTVLRIFDHAIASDEYHGGRK